MKVKEALLKDFDEVIHAKGQKKVILHEKMMGREYKRRQEDEGL